MEKKGGGRGGTYLATKEGRRGKGTLSRPSPPGEEIRHKKDLREKKEEKEVHHFPLKL